MWAFIVFPSLPLSGLRPRRADDAPRRALRATPPRQSRRRPDDGRSRRAQPLVRDADRADLCRGRLQKWLGDEDAFSPEQLNAVQLAGEADLQLHDVALLREILRPLDHDDRESTGAAAADSLIKAPTPDDERMMPRDRDLLLCGADVADYRRYAEALLRGDAPRG